MFAPQLTLLLYLLVKAKSFNAATQYWVNAVMLKAESETVLSPQKFQNHILASTHTYTFCTLTYTHPMLFLISPSEDLFWLTSYHVHHCADAFRPDQKPMQKI